MGAVPLVVPSQPLLHVARNRDAIPRSTLRRFEHVDESLSIIRRKFIADGNAPDFRAWRSDIAQSRKFLRMPGSDWIAESAKSSLALRS
jgi:hypothetical protein